MDKGWGKSIITAAKELRAELDEYCRLLEPKYGRSVYEGVRFKPVVYKDELGLCIDGPLEGEWTHVGGYRIGDHIWILKSAPGEMSQEIFVCPKIWDEHEYLLQPQGLTFVRTNPDYFNINS